MWVKAMKLVSWPLCLDSLQSILFPKENIEYAVKQQQTEREKMASDFRLRPAISAWLVLWFIFISADNLYYKKRVSYIKRWCLYRHCCVSAVMLLLCYAEKSISTTHPIVFMSLWVEMYWKLRVNELWCVLVFKKKKFTECKLLFNWFNCYFCLFCLLFLPR